MFKSDRIKGLMPPKIAWHEPTKAKHTSIIISTVRKEQFVILLYENILKSSL